MWTRMEAHARGTCRRLRLRGGSGAGASAPHVLAKNPLQVDAGVVVEPGKLAARSPASELGKVGLDPAIGGREVRVPPLSGGGPARGGATSPRTTARPGCGATWRGASALTMLVACIMAAPLISHATSARSCSLRCQWTKACTRV